MDIDRGYTDWNPEDPVRIIKEESCSIGYRGPVIVAIDHGGPWVKTYSPWKNGSLQEQWNGQRNLLKMLFLPELELI